MTAQPPHSALPSALGLPARGVVAVIGGGGKTTLIAALAHARPGALVTTTTRILRPSADVALGPPAKVAAATRARRDATPLTVAAGAEGPKLVGYAAPELDALAALLPERLILVEADGSRGLSLKAHGPHEPVVPASAALTVAVVGLDILGAPLDEAHVHRSPLFAQRHALAPGTRLTADHVAAALLGEAGYAAHAAGGLVVYLSKDDGGEGAPRLAAAIWHRDTARRVSRVVSGALRDDDAPALRVWVR